MTLSAIGRPFARLPDQPNPVATASAAAAAVATSHRSDCRRAGAACSRIDHLPALAKAKSIHPPIPTADTTAPELEPLGEFEASIKAPIATSREARTAPPISTLAGQG
jgi:hypothetical protein